MFAEALCLEWVTAEIIWPGLAGGGFCLAVAVGQPGLSEPFLMSCLRSCWKNDSGFHYSQAPPRKALGARFAQDDRLSGELRGVEDEPGGEYDVSRAERPAAKAVFVAKRYSWA